MKLDLTKLEAAVLLGFLRLGIDSFNGIEPNAAAVELLDRVPTEAFDALADKLQGATL